MTNGHIGSCTNLIFTEGEPKFQQSQKQLSANFNRIMNQNLCMSFFSLFFFFFLLRRPISPGSVLSFSPPPSSLVRRRYHATSTAWRSSRAVRSSCPITTTWSTAAAPASSAQVNISCLQQQQRCVRCMFECDGACVALCCLLLQRKPPDLIYVSEKGAQY